MTPQPPPCQHCGHARLMTGLCPHCEHVYCVLCNNFMSIIEYADHMWCHRFSYQYEARKTRLLFWWEMKRDWPVRCPDCDTILNNDGTCPALLATPLESRNPVSPQLAALMKRHQQKPDTI